MPSSHLLRAWRGRALPRSVAGAWPVACLLACLAAAGCASLDPAQDIDRAATLVAERSGAEVQWTVPWDDLGDEPGDEPDAAWDGQQSLSADAAVRAALRNNRAIRREVESIVAARAQYVQAHLLPNPVISLMLGVPIDGGGGTPLAASAVQQLAWLWRRPPMIDAATAALQARVLAVSDAALRLVADVRQAHADVVFAERAQLIQQRNIELVRQVESLLEARFEAGEASRLDVNRVELDYQGALVDLADRRAALDRAQRRLLEMLGRADQPCDWRTDDQPAMGDIEPALPALDEPAIVHLATTQRLDVAAAEATRQAMAHQVALAERGSLDVSAGAGYQREFSDRRGIFPTVTVSPGVLDDNRARIALAASELQQATIEADRVSQAAVAAARDAWVALQQQQTVVRAYEQDVLVLAGESMELARAAFDAGEIDLTVLLEAQRRHNDAHLELSDRRRDLVRLALELQRAVGGALSMPPLPDQPPVLLRKPRAGSAAIALRKTGMDRSENSR